MTSSGVRTFQSGRKDEQLFSALFLIRSYCPEGKILSYVVLSIVTSLLTSVSGTTTTTLTDFQS